MYHTEKKKADISHGCDEPLYTGILNVQRFNVEAEDGGLHKRFQHGSCCDERW